MSKLRWHHLYSLLAGFDMLVIAGGIWLFRATAADFESLLQQQAVSDARHRYIAALGQSVLALTAPGNDVFRSGDWQTEQSRFNRMSLELGAIKARGNVAPVRQRKFWSEIQQMVAAEHQIFELLRDALQASGRDADLFKQAAHAMARMDACQARAMRLLAAEQEVVSTESAKTLTRHQATLGERQVASGVLAAALVLALAGMVGYARHLHRAQVELQTQRQRAERERRERLAAIGELCTGVAHGIQNPLAGIHSSAELIVDLGQVDAESRRRARDVMVESERLSRRVARLLGFARGVAVTRRPAELQPILHALLDEFAPRLRARSIAVRISAVGPEPVVQADPEELTTIFLELLSNALQHSPRDGVINVTVITSQDRVNVEVRDQGSGVPPAIADRVFDLFFTTRTDGTGVGLAWAARIAQSLAGGIELVGDDQPGAAFRVDLPRAVAQSERDDRGVSGVELPASNHCVGEAA